MTAAKLLSAIEPVIRYHRGRFRGGRSVDHDVRGRVRLDVRLVDAVRYRIPAPGGGHAWPGSPAGLEPELRTAVRGWSLAADGSLSVELNARQEAGATPSLKKLLEGLGLDEHQAVRVRAVREALVLRPRAATAEPSTCADEVAAS